LQPGAFREDGAAGRTLSETGFAERFAATATATALPPGVPEIHQSRENSQGQYLAEANLVSEHDLVFGESLEEPPAYWSQPKVRRRALFVFLIVLGVVVVAAAVLARFLACGVVIRQPSVILPQLILPRRLLPQLLLPQRLPLQLLLPQNLPISTAAIQQSVVSTPARSRFLTLKTLTVFSLQTARIPTLRFQQTRTVTARSTIPAILLEGLKAARLARLSHRQEMDDKSPTTVPIS
jgi:hypothetical protein